MPKLCGKNESCFVPGECWGHFSGVLCANLIELPDHSSSCALDGAINNVLYTNDDEYQLATKQMT